MDENVEVPEGVQRGPSPHAVQFKKMTANIELLFPPSLGVMRVTKIRDRRFFVPAKPCTYDEAVGQMSQQSSALMINRDVAVLPLDRKSQEVPHWNCRSMRG